MAARTLKYTHVITLKSGARFLAVAVAESPIEVWARGRWAANPQREATHKWGREAVERVEPLTLFSGGAS